MTRGACHLSQLIIPINIPITDNPLIFSYLEKKKSFTSLLEQDITQMSFG